MGQGPQKSTQINQAQLGWQFGFHPCEEIKVLCTLRSLRHRLFSCWLPIKTPRKRIYRTWNILFLITEDKQISHKHILEYLYFYWRLTILFPRLFFHRQSIRAWGGQEGPKRCHKNCSVIFFNTGKNWARQKNPRQKSSHHITGHDI